MIVISSLKQIYNLASIQQRFINLIFIRNERLTN
jgi:hypothetical protein